MIVQLMENYLTDAYKKNTANRFNFPVIIKLVRILGLIALISYIAVILYTWILASREGFTYFSAGEPSSPVRYSEWILGFLAFFVAIYYLLMELLGYNCIRVVKS